MQKLRSLFLRLVMLRYYANLLIKSILNGIHLGNQPIQIAQVALLLARQTMPAGQVNLSWCG